MYICLYRRESLSSISSLPFEILSVIFRRHRDLHRVATLNGWTTLRRTCVCLTSRKHGQRSRYPILPYRRPLISSPVHSRMLNSTIVHRSKPALLDIAIKADVDVESEDMLAYRFCTLPIRTLTCFFDGPCCSLHDLPSTIELTDRPSCGCWRKSVASPSTYYVVVPIDYTASRLNVGPHPQLSLHPTEIMTLFLNCLVLVRSLRIFSYVFQDNIIDRRISLLAICTLVSPRPSVIMTSLTLLTLGFQAPALEQFNFPLLKGQRSRPVTDRYYPIA